VTRTGRKKFHTTVKRPRSKARASHVIKHYIATMDRIPIRSLIQDTAGVLARVEQGETVEIDTAALVKLVRPEAAVRATAGAYPEPGLRSVDAIHLATAEFLVASGQPISAFVTYDKRLAEVVERAGLTVVAPG
jgi:predicted nucleic acid-binding protein